MTRRIRGGRCKCSRPRTMSVSKTPVRVHRRIADFDAQGRLLVIGQPGGAYVADLFTADFDRLNREVIWVCHRR